MLHHQIIVNHYKRQDETNGIEVACSIFQEHSHNISLILFFQFETSCSFCLHLKKLHSKQLCADSLWYTSAASILLAIVFIMISLGISVYAVIKGTVKMPRMFPDFSRLSSPFELFTAVPVTVVAFTFHFNGKVTLKSQTNRVSIQIVLTKHMKLL